MRALGRRRRRAEIRSIVDLSHSNRLLLAVLTVRFAVACRPKHGISHATVDDTKKPAAEIFAPEAPSAPSKAGTPEHYANIPHLPPPLRTVGLARPEWQRGPGADQCHVPGSAAPGAAHAPVVRSLDFTSPPEWVVMSADMKTRHGCHISEHLRVFLSVQDCQWLLVNLTGSSGGLNRLCFLLCRLVVRRLFSRTTSSLGDMIGRWAWRD